jgi:hypothetical protein
MADACTLEACSIKKIYPKTVVSSIRQQLKSLQLDPPQQQQPLQVPSRMELDECLKAANLRDAAVRTIQYCTAIYSDSVCTHKLLV